LHPARSIVLASILLRQRPQRLINPLLVLVRTSLSHGFAESGKWCLMFALRLVRAAIGHGD
jgi:hypothetical protein